VGFKQVLILVLQVVWNAWLATMGHSAVDSLDTSGLVDQASEALQNVPVPANVAAFPALAHTLQQAAVAHASPFFSRAGDAVQVRFVHKCHC
jgi:hypothetical protein